MSPRHGDPGFNQGSGAPAPLVVGTQVAGDGKREGGRCACEQAEHARCQRPAAVRTSVKPRPAANSACERQKGPMMMKIVGPFLEQFGKLS